MTLLCPACFDNKGLRRRIEDIRPDYDEGKCDFHPRRKGVPIEVVSGIVDEVFRANYGVGEIIQHYDPDPDEPYIHRTQSGERLTDTLASLTGAIDERVVDALAEQLESDESLLVYHYGDEFYGEHFRYERTDPGDAGHGALWQRYCESVMHGQRFFNDGARHLLGEIFKNIHLQRDTSRQYPVFMLDPACAPAFHRARVIPDSAAKAVLDYPVVELGPPPLRGGKPNRMNVSGIPAFYASFELDTCVSELRPLVGDFVAHAQFRARRPLCVLDTTRFEAPPRELNLFAMDHIRRLAQWRFMQRLTAEIARPISPADEHIDYVPTQVVAEFLNKVHEVRMGRQKRHIDAIVYWSAQRPGGRNIVILGSAGTIEHSPDASKVTQPTKSTLDLKASDEKPEEPGLSLSAASVRITKVAKADFGLDEAGGLLVMLQATSI